MSGGSLVSRGGGKFIARPASVGNPVTISVSAKGRKIGEYKFRVRKLPDPAPYIAMGGDRFKSGALSKAALMSATGIHAAIDDGLLDIPFSVTASAQCSSTIWVTQYHWQVMAHSSLHSRKSSSVISAATSFLHNKCCCSWS